MAVDRLIRQMFAILRDADISNREDRLAVMRGIVCRNEVNSLRDLSEIELDTVVSCLKYWKRTGDLRRRCNSFKEAHRRHPATEVEL